MQKLLTLPAWDNLFGAAMPACAKKFVETLRIAIPGHEDYASDSHGNIYSLITQKVLKPSHADSASRARVELRGGYRPVSGRSSQRFYVGRLVLLAFHGAPPCFDSPIVHVDGNKDNNHAENLKWGLSPFLRKYFVDAQDVREVYNGRYVDRYGKGWAKVNDLLYPFLFGGQKQLTKTVAEKFIGVPPRGFVLRHKDGNTLNRAVENLYWRPRRGNDGFSFFRIQQEQQQLIEALKNYDTREESRRNGTAPTATDNSAISSTGASTDPSSIDGTIDYFR